MKKRVSGGPKKGKRRMEEEITLMREREREEGKERQRKRGKKITNPRKSDHEGTKRRTEEEIPS